jgi:hypothetical protein
MTKIIDIRPLSGSSTEKNYRDLKKPIYVASIESSKGFKTHSLQVGTNPSWVSDMISKCMVRIEDDGNDVHIYFGRDEGKTIDLNLSEVSELRILLNLISRHVPNMLEEYESVEYVERVEKL